MINIDINLKHLYVLLFLTMFFSCKNKTQKISEDTQTFQLLDKPIKNLKDYTNPQGEIMYQKFWLDAKGENVVFFCKRGLELLVDHHIFMDENYSKLRMFYDASEEACEYDFFGDYIESSISITDVDKNNLGEITFAYNLDCISDLTPLSLTLFMIEHGEKYKITGTNILNLGDETIGGQTTIDSSFINGPAAFLEHAKQVWKEIQ